MITEGRDRIKFIIPLVITYTTKTKEERQDLSNAFVLFSDRNRALNADKNLKSFKTCITFIFIFIKTLHLGTIKLLYIFVIHKKL